MFRRCVIVGDVFSVGISSGNAIAIVAAIVVVAMVVVAVATVSCIISSRLWRWRTTQWMMLGEKGAQQT